MEENRMNPQNGSGARRPRPVRAPSGARTQQSAPQPPKQAPQATPTAQAMPTAQAAPTAQPRSMQQQAAHAPQTTPQPMNRTLQTTAQPRRANPQPATAAAHPRRAEKPKKRGGAGRVIRRILLCLLVLLISALYVLFSAVATVAHGPSESVRDLLVLSAMQASATKWVPGLFLDKETVDTIVANSKKVNTDTVSMEDYGTSSEVGTQTDAWDKAIDGMLFETVNGSTYKAYILLVKDPSRVFVGTSSDFRSGKQGARIFDTAKKYNAVAAINGGEFHDAGGVGTGDNPIGTTYSQGKLVWNDGQNKRTFMGFDKDNKLIVTEGMSAKEADTLGIRDGVCFQTGNVLITHDGDDVTMYYADSNTGTAQRTAIGQRADGTVILLVTDGRSASSLGATHNDVIDIMVDYGAVVAGMLDGGSSAMMYYENYFDKYGFDTEKLDQYQKQGLVNKYKAFTTPRKIPTFFLVAGDE